MNYTSNYKYVQGTGPGTGYVYDYKASMAPSYPTSYPTSNRTTTMTKKSEIQCCNVVEFTFILIAWGIAQIFGCGKLGKMTYAQLIRKYWKG